MTARRSVTIDGQQTLVDAPPGNGIEIVSIGGNVAEIRSGGKSWFVPFVVSGSEVSFAFDGEIYFATVEEGGKRSRSRSRDQSMAAPMPGQVLKIFVSPGDVVTRGTPLLILEAMKMEHQIVAPRAGVVAAIRCQVGELVQPGPDLVELQAGVADQTES